MYEYISSEERLVEVVKICSEKPVLALDTEFARTNTYYPIVGLIQIFDGENCYLIDPLAIDDLSSLAPLLADNNIVKILHACSEDMEVFQYALGVTPSPTFDSQIAAAVLGVGFSISYQKLVEHYLSLLISKEETRSDWLKRPLKPSQLEYAALDVIHLFSVYEKQQIELEKSDRLSWVTDDCFALPSKIATLVEPETYYLKVKNTNKLNGSQLNLLRALCAWREKKARKLNIPRNRVVDEKSLFQIAIQNMSSFDEIKHASLLTPGQSRRHENDLRDVLSTAHASPKSDYPNVQQNSKTPINNKTLKRLKALVEARALELNISHELIVKRRQLEQLLRSEDNKGQYHLPESLRGWREAVIGEILMEAVAK